MAQPMVDGELVVMATVFILLLPALIGFDELLLFGC